MKKLKHIAIKHPNEQHDAYLATGIYFVVCIGPYAEEERQRHRCWGWYKDLEDAVKAVEKNHTDINEAGYYPYAIIEKVPNGVLPVGVEEIHWFKWKGGREKGGYVKITKPVWSKNICNWSIG